MRFNQWARSKASCNLKRDSLSLITLETPGICLALKYMLCWRVVNTRRLTNFIMFGSLDDDMLTIYTTAWLSHMNRILWLRNLKPHVSMARTIGNIGL